MRFANLAGVLMLAASPLLLAATPTPTPTPTPDPVPIVVSGAGTLLTELQGATVVATIDLCAPDNATLPGLLGAHPDVADQITAALGGPDPAGALAVRRAVCVTATTTATPAPTATAVPTSTTPTATARPTATLPPFPTTTARSSASSLIPSGSVDTGTP